MLFGLTCLSEQAFKLIARGLERVGALGELLTLGGELGFSLAELNLELLNLLALLLHLKGELVAVLLKFLNALYVKRLGLLALLGELLALKGSLSLLSLALSLELLNALKHRALYLNAALLKGGALLLKLGELSAVAHFELVKLPLDGGLKLCAPLCKALLLSLSSALKALTEALLSLMELLLVMGAELYLTLTQLCGDRPLKITLRLALVSVELGLGGSTKGLYLL